MTAFDRDVLRNDPADRGTVLAWLESALTAIDPVGLTREAFVSAGVDEASVIAIGKAAPAMVRGAAQAARITSGVCVSHDGEEVHPQVTALKGDHPIPGEASFTAGAAVLEFARNASTAVPLIALVSGGGSALCEAPRPGVPLSFISGVASRLLASGMPIERMNLVRSQLSTVKCGGVARAAGRRIDTYVISDVAGADPGVVASRADDPSAIRRGSGSGDPPRAGCRGTRARPPRIGSRSRAGLATAGDPPR